MMCLERKQELLRLVLFLEFLDLGLEFTDLSLLADQ